jgi:hypothetical protein
LIILFDHGTPAPLRRLLPCHQIDTAWERGWEALANGDLLDQAEGNGYEVLLTSDHSIRYQQNLSNRRIAILVLLHNGWPSVRLEASDILPELNRLEPGDYREMEI